MFGAALFLQVAPFTVSRSPIGCSLWNRRLALLMGFPVPIARRRCRLEQQARPFSGGQCHREIEEVSHASEGSLRSPREP